MKMDAASMKNYIDATIQISRVMEALQGSDDAAVIVDDEFMRVFTTFSQNHMGTGSKELDTSHDDHAGRNDADERGYPGTGDAIPGEGASLSPSGSGLLSRVSRTAAQVTATAAAPDSAHRWRNSSVDSNRSPARLGPACCARVDVCSMFTTVSTRGGG